jgi:RNA polymerase sigma factor (sigma-70 family)
VRIPILEGVAVNDVDRDDIAALARALGPAVFRAAWRILGSRAAAEDVQQQLFLRLIESPPQRVQNWQAYLTASATRLAIDHLRSLRRWRILTQIWKGEESEDSPDEDVARAQASAFMRAALAKLKPRDAQCFILRHLHGLAPATIGTAMGISENHVSVSVHRARKALEAMQAQEGI